MLFNLGNQGNHNHMDSHQMGILLFLNMNEGISGENLLGERTNILIAVDSCIWQVLGSDRVPALNRSQVQESQ